MNDTVQPVPPPPADKSAAAIAASPATDSPTHSTPNPPGRNRVGRWLRGLFGTARPAEKAGDSGEQDTAMPPESATELTPNGGPAALHDADADGSDSQHLVEAESPESRIRAEHEPFPTATPLIDLDHNEAPALAERIEELEGSLREREQDLQNIRGELESMGRDGDREQPSEPPSTEPSPLTLEAPSLDGESSGAFRIPTWSEREQLPGHVARTRELFEARERELRAERDRMQAELERLREELEHRLTRLEGERDSALAEVDAYRGKFTDLERATGDLHSEIQRERDLLERSRQSEAEARTSGGEADRLRDELDASRSREASNAAELIELKKRLDDREQALLAAEASRDNLSVALREAEERGERFAEERLSALKVRSEHDASDLQSRLASTEAIRTRLEAELEALKESTTRERAELLATTSRELDETRNAAAHDIEEVLDGLDQLRADFEGAEGEMVKRIQGQTREIGRLTAELSEREGDIEAATTRELRLSAELAQLRQQSGAERAEAQNELKLRFDRIASLQRERDGLSQALTEKSALSASLDTRFHERTEMVRNLEAQMARLKATAEERLTELKKAVAEREVDLTRARGEAELRGREAADLRGQIPAREQRLREVEGRLAAVTTDKENREREYVATRSRLETQLSELRAELEDRGQRIAFLQEQSNKTEARAIEMEDRAAEALKRLEARTAEYREAFSKKQDEAKTAVDSLAAREQEFRRFATELQARDRVRAAEIERLEGKVKEKDKEVNDLLKLMESKTDALLAAEAVKARAVERATALEQRTRALEERGQSLEARSREAESRLEQVEPRWRTAEEKMRETDAALRQAEERLQVVDHKYRGAEQAARSALERAAMLEQKLRAADEHLGTLAHDLEDKNKRVHELETSLSQLETERRSAASGQQLLAERDAAEAARAMDGELIARLRETLAEREAELRRKVTEAEELESTRAELLTSLMSEREEHGGLREQLEADAVRRRRFLGPLASLSLTVRAMALALLAAIGGFALARAVGPRTPVAASTTSPATSALVPGTLSAALPTATAEESSSARELVRRWATAIENRDWKGLLAMYDARFHRPTLPDRKAFEAETIEMLRTAEWLAVELDRLEVKRAADGRLVAVFPFELRTHGHLDFGRRELWLERERDGSLRISDERWADAAR